MSVLSKDDLKSVSGAGTRSGQEAWLKQQGIPYKHNRCGELVVCWKHVHEWIEGRPPVRFAEPDFSLPVPARSEHDEPIESLLILPTIEVIPAGSLPASGEVCGVYALFGELGELNYIGQSFDVGARVIQHMRATGRKARLPFVEYGYVPVPSTMLDAVEIAHIYALEPLENRKFEQPCWDRHAEAVQLLRAAWGEKREV